MKTRGPLAGQKTLPMRQFRTIGLERQMRTALGPMGARKTTQSSLKIEGLRSAGFRAHVSAATLKPESLTMEESQALKVSALT